jgi:hypothetical protein
MRRRIGGGDIKAGGALEEELSPALRQPDGCMEENRRGQEEVEEWQQGLRRLGEVKVGFPDGLGGWRWRRCAAAGEVAGVGTFPFGWLASSCVLLRHLAIQLWIAKYTKLDPSFTQVPNFFWGWGGKGGHL